MELFRLQGVVEILTGQSDKQLANIHAKIQQLEGQLNQAQALLGKMGGALIQGLVGPAGAAGTAVDNVKRSVQSFAGAGKTAEMTARQMVSQMGMLGGIASQAATPFRILDESVRKVTDTFDKFGRETEEAQAKLQGWATQIDLTASRTQAAMTPMGNFVTGMEKAATQIDMASASLLRMSIALGAIAAPFAFAAQKAGEFDSEMRQANTLAGMIEPQFRTMSDQVRNLTTQFDLATGPISNAAALYDIYGAGVTQAAASIDTLVVASQAATAGATEAAVAGDVLTSVMNAYGRENLDAAQAADILFRTIDVGKVSFDQIAIGLGQSLGLAKNANVELDELGAVIATLTAKGLPARQAMTSLAAILRQLSAPSKEAQDAMAELGLKIDTNSIRQMGLAKTIQLVSDAAQGNTGVLRKLLGEVNAVNAVLTLTADGGDRYVSTQNKIAQAAGSTASAFEEQAKGARVAGQQLQASFEAASIAFAQTFAPAVLVGMKVLTDFFKMFNELPPLAQGVIAGVTGLGATLAALGLAIPFAVQGAKALGSAWVAARVALMGTAAVAPAAAAGIGTSAAAAATAAAAANGLAGATTAAATATVALNPALLAIVATGAAVASVYTVMRTNIRLQEQALKEQTQRINEQHDALKNLQSAIMEFSNLDTRQLLDLGFTAADINARKEALEAYIARLMELKRSGQAGAGVDAAIARAAEQRDELNKKANEALELEPKLRREYADTANKLRINIQNATKAYGEFQAQQQAGVFATKKEELARFDEVMKKFQQTQAALASAPEAAKTGIDVEGITASFQQMQMDRIKLSREADEEITKGEKEASDKRFDARVASIENELAAREITKTQALQLYQDLLDEEGILADQRVKLEQKVASLKGQLIDETTRKAEQASRDIQSAIRAEADAMQARVQGIDQQIDALIDQGAKEAEINKLLAERKQLLIDIAKAEGEQKKMSAKTAREREAIEQSTSQTIENIGNQTVAKQEEVAEKRARKEEDAASRIGDLQNRYRDTQIAAMEDQAQKLKEKEGDTSQQRKEILQQQLRLRLQNMDEELRQALAQAEREKASEQEKTLIKQIAEQEKRQAIQDTRDKEKAIEAEREGSSMFKMGAPGMSHEEAAAIGFTGFGQGFGKSFFADQDDSAVISPITSPFNTGSGTMGAGNPPTTGNDGEVEVDIQPIQLQFNVAGEIIVADAGPLSESTALQVVTELGLMDHIQGGRPAELGVT